LQLGNLPSISVQGGIGATLGALDDKIAVNDRIVLTCRELSALQYRNSAVSGVELVRIGEIAQTFDGPHATPKKTESGPWFLSISSLSDGRLLLGESAHLSESDFIQWTRRVTPQPGDVLFSYETRLGEAALMPSGIRACLGRRMALLRPHNIGPRTLLQAFMSPSFQEVIRQHSVHGATVDRIPLTDFPAWQIELPSCGLAELESTLAALDDIAQLRERENEKLAEIRDALLPRLMSGEIRVRDAQRVVEDVT
jgi:type I restriction enzyme S subunit